MQRYFIKTLNHEDTVVKISGENAHHIIRVMRMKENDRVICVNNFEQSALCVIKKIDTEVVILNVIQWLEESVELPVHVTIAQGIPKGDKFDFILQKATELGVNEIIPWSSERSVSIWDERKYEKKKVRFNKILKEASEQSHRTKIPVLRNQMTTKNLLDESNAYDHVVFAFEDEARKKNYHSFSEIIGSLKVNERILVCIGPEGGISKNEVNHFFEKEWNPIRLGPRILRTETASLYVLSSISYQLEELRST